MEIQQQVEPLQALSDHFPHHQDLAKIRPDWDEPWTVILFLLLRNNKTNSLITAVVT